MRLQRSLPSVALQLYLILILPLFATPLHAVAYEAGGQYILFDGIISGIVTFSPEYVATCGRAGVTIPPLSRTSLSVGKYPPWDTNPFFFELSHYATDNAPSLVGGFTKDNIYNLMFTSAYYECYKDNFPCGSGIISNPYYIGQEYFDLNKTVMTKGKVGEEDGFTITGGKATYVGNKTRNYVDVEASCYGTSDVKIISWLGTQWNAFTSYNYSLTFSNTTAEMNITTTKPNSSMTLIFKGKRNETGDLGPVTPIELDSSSDSPRFRYVNDSEIYFTKGSGSWKAAATPFSTSSTAKPTATGNSAVRTVGSFADACVYGIGAVALLDLFG